MLKTINILLLAMLCVGMGNIFMRKGLKTVGVLESYRLRNLFRFFYKAVTNPFVLLGVLLCTGYFMLWLVVLSWADLSWALPMNAVEYIFVAIAAGIFLHEKVGFYRWMGIGFIGLGMFLMMGSWV